MGNVMAYSGITTKIRAMQANLLTDKDFETIAGFPSVAEVIDYLKEKPAYAEYMNQLDSSLYHRGDVEKVLYQSLYDDYTRIYRFAGVKQKKFLKLYWKRYEVDLINYCLRIVFNHYDQPFDLNYKKKFFDRYSKISIDKLITSRNIDELVDNLKDTEYYKPLGELKDSGAATLLDYDRALDMYYYATFWRQGRKICEGKAGERFKRDVGTKIDMLNLQWIYRAKKYYHMLPPDIYMLTIPYQCHLKPEEFKQIVEAPTVEEMEKHLKATYYGKRYDLDDAKTREKRMYDALKALYVSDQRKDPYSDATINAYLFLKEEEIDKLTTALECIRYGLTQRETLGYLGGVNR